LVVARHLPHCAECRVELAGFLATADQLAFAMPLRTPPPGLKDKILNRVSQAPQPVSRPAVLSASPPPRSRSLRDIFGSLFTSPAGLAFGALALLLLVFMAASNFLLWQRVNDLQARVPPTHVQLVRLAGTAEAPQAQGYLMVFDKETYGTLVVEHAPPLAQDLQYQLWLIRDGKRTNGGVFSVGKDGYGVLEVWADQPLETFPSFGITVEPAGGSPAPTGKKVLGGDL
jgi:hypothetical protein